jgi:hypothetical protein
MPKAKPSFTSLVNSLDGSGFTSSGATESLINLIEGFGGVSGLDVEVAGKLTSGRPIWSWVSSKGHIHLIRLLAIQKALEELKEFKPLTIRQVFYYLVGQGEIKNERKYYDEIDEVIKYGRIEGQISWNDIEDRTRVHHNFRGWSNAKSFVKDELDEFMVGYRHDYMKDQKKYLEVWIEKDALASIFTKFAEPYGVSVEVCRGNQSISRLHEYHKRIAKHLREYCKRIKKHPGQQPVLLYFGDFDPCGMKMFDSMQITLIEEMNVTGIDFKRIALVEGDIKKYNLPHDFRAIKPGDTNAKWFIQKYGEHAVELDALKPKALGKIITDAIEAEIDMKLYKKEQRAAKRAKAKLKKLREKMLKLFLKKGKKGPGGSNTPPKKKRPKKPKGHGRKRNSVVREIKTAAVESKGDALSGLLKEFGLKESDIPKSLLKMAKQYLKNNDDPEEAMREIRWSFNRRKMEKDKKNSLEGLLEKLGLEESDVPKSLLTFTKQLFEDDPDNAMRKAKWAFNFLKIKKESAKKSKRDKVLDFLQAMGMGGFIKGFGYSGGWRNIPDSVLFSFAKYSGKKAKDMNEAYENVKKQYDDYIGKIIRKEK